MRTYKLTLAYDGTNYVGWQRQTNGVSVQQLVEEAFAPLVGGVAPTVAGASRTDAGAHALGQVASVNADIDMSPLAGPARAERAAAHGHSRHLRWRRPPLGFHARFKSVAKSYRYRIVTAPVMSPFDRFFVWHAPEPKRLDWMQEAAAVLVGRHDFASFQARGAFVRETVRTIHRLTLARSRRRDSRSNAKATGFFGTWCARSPARWRKSARASGRRPRCATSWRRATGAPPAPPRRRPA